jgi:hypothetical protein
MITWTPSAREEFERHVATVRTQLIAVGADADEVATDLQHHVEEELSAANIKVATREDVQRVLARMGALPAEFAIGGTEETRQGTSSEHPSGPPVRKKPSGVANFFLGFFGVALPVAALVVELITGTLGETVLNPVPTLGHVVAIALVPMANALAIWFTRRGCDDEHPVWLLPLNGAAAAIALVYALLLAPVTPFAAIGILFFGLGLLPLAPLLGLICALVLRRRLTGQPQTRGKTLRAWWLGSAVAFAAMLALELPSAFTRAGLHMATSEDAETVARGLRLMRSVGSEERLRQACYPRNAAAHDLVGFLFNLDRRVSIEQARTVYYRVTGKMFNAAQPPKRFGDPEWVWDEDRGRDNVGQRLKHLSMTQSRMDGIVDGDSLSGYLEWTMVFKNSAERQPHEARAQIQLPPGGVVSRLTLWINGEEQEAAFAGRSQVKQAYQNIVRQNRDPVLVTTKGPDRVLMQCFPVPANGGEMKVRVGISFPLHLDQAEVGLLRLPQLLEQNFGSANVEHGLWLEAVRPMQTATGGLQIEKTTQGVHALRGGLKSSELAASSTIRVSRDPNATKVWSALPRLPDTLVTQRIVAHEPATKPGALTLVVDGSSALIPHLGVIADAVAALPKHSDVTVFFASDAVRSTTGQSAEAAAAWLRQQSCVGGQDNLDALGAAWDAAAARGGVVFWIHGHQPCTWQSAEALLQRETRRAGQVEIRSFTATPGPNLVLEKLDGLPRVTAAPRFGSLEEDLARELRRLANGEKVLVIREAHVGGVETKPERQDATGHVARLWAAEETGRLLSAGRREQAVKLAAQFQLVTPVSGAVVLETRQQFAAAGLTPVDPSSTPVVPEPATVALILGGVAIIFVVVRKRLVRRGLIAVN